MIRVLFAVLLMFWVAASPSVTWGGEIPFPGERGERLDTACRSDVWEKPARGFLGQFVRVPRDEVVGFALYTHDHGVLKLSAQLYPLKEDEPREVRLELKTDGQWREVATAPVVYPGWSAHFRMDGWDKHPRRAVSGAPR